MLKYILYIFVTGIANYSFSQTTNYTIQNDSTEYSNYLDSSDGISFNYPKNWDQMKIVGQYLFTAEEQLTDENDKFKENLILGKVEISADLEFLLKSSIKSIQQNNEKAVIVDQEVKTNINDVRHAVLKYTSSINNIQCETINIYFKKGKYGYYLIMGSALQDERRYSKIYGKIVDSIKFVN